MSSYNGYEILMDGCKKHLINYGAETSDKNSDRHKAIKGISPLSRGARISLNLIHKFPSNLPTTAMVADPIVTMERRLKLVYRIALEFFFSKNAYPSRPEKSLIAKECGMSYKQISTWFQNRRDRPKDNQSIDFGLKDYTIQDLGRYMRRRLQSYPNHHQPEPNVLPQDSLKTLSPLEKSIKSDSSANQKKPLLEAHVPAEVEDTSNDIFSFPKPAWIRRRRPSCAKDERARYLCDVDQMIIGFESCQLKATSSSLSTLSGERNQSSKEPLHPARIIKNLPRRKNHPQNTGASLSVNERTCMSDPVDRVSLPHRSTLPARSCSGSSIAYSTESSDSESGGSDSIELEQIRNRHNAFNPIKSLKLPRKLCFDKVLSWREGSNIA